jgi:hypothetical protein
MHLKKNLKTGQVPLEIPKRLSLKHKFLTGQASLEYFILLAIIGGLTFLSLTTFWQQTQKSGEELFHQAAARILGVPY